MNTLLTLHLVNIQPVFIFFIFLAGCLVAVSWMLVIKSSRYTDLLKSLVDEKTKAELTAKEWSEHIQLVSNDSVSIVKALEKRLDDEINKVDTWKRLYNDLKATLPKPRERDNDGKFVKGSSRLDNLRKHLLEGNRTDRFTAQESFGIAHVGKFISTLKKEGFDIRKEKRKIAKDSFLTEYYLVPKKEVRQWTPAGNYEGIHEGLYDGLKEK
jgi:hypothetical protein